MISLNTHGHMNKFYEFSSYILRFVIRECRFAFNASSLLKLGLATGSPVACKLKQAYQKRLCTLVDGVIIITYCVA